jgi:hypothetical protein
MKHVISAGIIAILVAAAIGAAKVNALDLYSVDYTEVFCGRPLPFLRPAERVGTAAGWQRGNGDGQHIPI